MLVCVTVYACWTWFVFLDVIFYIFVGFLCFLVKTYGPTIHTSILWSEPRIAWQVCIWIKKKDVDYMWCFAFNEPRPRREKFPPRSGVTWMWATAFPHRQTPAPLRWKPRAVPTLHRKKQRVRRPYQYQKRKFAQSLSWFENKWVNVYLLSPFDVAGVWYWGVTKANIWYLA